MPCPPLAAQLDQQLGQRIIIENRGGAGGTTGASQASKASPDGYTWFIGAAHHTIAPHLYPKLDYNIETDFVPVALLARPPQVLVVNPKVQAKSVAELIALAKANPGKLNFGLPVSAPPISWRQNCSRPRPEPICPMCPIAALARPWLISCQAISI